MDNDLKDYFVGGMKTFGTDSPGLISSSMWLNDPRVRDLVARLSLRRNHKDVPLTVDLVEVVPILRDMGKNTQGFIEAMISEERKNNSALDAWFEERFVSNFTLDTLKECPPGSVGDLFRQYLVLNDFAPEFKGERYEGAGQLDYFQLRLSQQHDLEHILGGHRFDWIGEQSVTWMRYASYLHYLSPGLAGALGSVYCYLLTPLMTRTLLHYPHTFNQLWDITNDAINVGRTSQPIFMMKYEDVLHLPLAEARAKIGYRNVVDRDTTKLSELWSEGCETAKDPRTIGSSRAA